MHNAGRPTAKRSTVPLGLPALLSAMLAVAACTSEPARVTTSSGGKSASLLAMETVAMAAHRCWFASKDPAFRSYRFANELNSFTGQPRFLLVPARDFGGRPLLVVQARGSSSRVETFGPLLSEPLGTRINADIARWAGGDSACAATG
jgi:hypothetical protein